MFIGNVAKKYLIKANITFLQVFIPITSMHAYLGQLLLGWNFGCLVSGKTLKAKHSLLHKLFVHLFGLKSLRLFLFCNYFFDMFHCAEAFQPHILTTITQIYEFHTECQRCQLSKRFLLILCKLIEASCLPFSFCALLIDHLWVLLTKSLSKLRQ